MQVMGWVCHHAAMGIPIFKLLNRMVGLIEDNLLSRPHPLPPKKNSTVKGDTGL